MAEMDESRRIIIAAATVPLAKIIKINKRSIFK